MLEGKAIMTDAVVAPTGIVSRSQFGAALTASFRDVSGDSIHRDFFPFSPGPYYATYPEGRIAGKYECSALPYDVSWWGAIGQKRCASFLGLESQISSFQKQVSDLNGKLSISDAAFSKSIFNGKNGR
ncbi:hypothetical protein Tco_0181201, partial [Tanacetum coccineum]